METSEDNQNEERPSAPELLGTAAEQVKRQGELAEQYDSGGYSAPHSNSSIYQLYVGIASLILLLLGLTALGVWFFTAESSEESSKTAVEEPASFIQTDDRTEVEVTNLGNLTTRLGQLPEESYEAENLTHIYFTRVSGEEEELISAHDLLAALSSDQPPIALYLDSNYMYGQYYDAEGDSYPYIIFAVTDYDNAYGTILQTEAALVSSLEPLGFPSVTDFTDAIIQNQDVRVATGGAGRELLYSFPRQNRLVITTNEAALREIFDRLRRR